MAPRIKKYAVAIYDTCGYHTTIYDIEATSSTVATKKAMRRAAVGNPSPDDYRIKKPKLKDDIFRPNKLRLQDNQFFAEVESLDGSDHSWFLVEIEPDTRPLPL